MKMNSRETIATVYVDQYNAACRPEDATSRLEIYMPSLFDVMTCQADKDNSRNKLPVHAFLNALKTGDVYMFEALMATGGAVQAHSPMWYEIKAHKQKFMAVACQNLAQLLSTHITKVKFILECRKILSALEYGYNEKITLSDVCAIVAKAHTSIRASLEGQEAVIDIGFTQLRTYATCECIIDLLKNTLTTFENEYSEEILLSVSTHACKLRDFVTIGCCEIFYEEAYIDDFQQCVNLWQACYDTYYNAELEVYTDTYLKGYVDEMIFAAYSTGVIKESV